MRQLPVFLGGGCTPHDALAVEHHTLETFGRPGCSTSIICRARPVSVSKGVGGGSPCSVPTDRYHYTYKLLPLQQPVGHELPCADSAAESK